MQTPPPLLNCFIKNKNVCRILLIELIGLELVVMESSKTILTVAFLLIAIGLLTRFVSVLIPSFFIRLKGEMNNKTLLLLTWGGLRGGISIALALSLPSLMDKEVWVTITYVIVCFSILVQGMTIGKLEQRMR